MPDYILWISEFKLSEISELIKVDLSVAWQPGAVDGEETAHLNAVEGCFDVSFIVLCENLNNYLNKDKTCN